MGVLDGVGSNVDGLEMKEDGSRLSLTLELFILLLSALRGVVPPTFIGELGGDSTSLRVNAGFALNFALSGGTLL